MRSHPAGAVTSPTASAKPLLSNYRIFADENVTQIRNHLTTLLSHSRRKIVLTDEGLYTHFLTGFADTKVHLAINQQPLHVQGVLPDNNYIVMLVLKGEGWCQQNGMRKSLIAGDMIVANPGSFFQSSTDTAFAALSYHVSRKRMQSAVQSDSGNVGRASLPIRFDEDAWASSLDRSALANFMKYCCEEIDAGNIGRNPAIDRSFEDFFISLLLSSFHHNFSSCLSERINGEPHFLQRADRFLSRHYDQPLKVEDIANAAGVGLRTFQVAFRKHRASTPMTYLRQIRLNNARRELHVAAAKGRSVTDIAVQNGFTNLGKFSQDYRDAFGELPSWTLKSRAGPSDQE